METCRKRNLLFQDSLEDVEVFATDAKKLPKPKPLGHLARSQSLCQMFCTTIHWDLCQWLWMGFVLRSFAGQGENFSGLCRILNQWTYRVTAVFDKSPWWTLGQLLGDVGEIWADEAHIHLSECSTTPNGIEDRLQTAPPALKLTENEFDVVVIPFVLQRPLQHHESQISNPVRWCLCQRPLDSLARFDHQALQRRSEGSAKYDVRNLVSEFCFVYIYIYIYVHIYIYIYVYILYNYIYIYISIYSGTKRFLFMLPFHGMSTWLHMAAQAGGASMLLRPCSVSRGPSLGIKLGLMRFKSGG